MRISILNQGYTTFTQTISRKEPVADTENAEKTENFGDTLKEIQDKLKARADELKKEEEITRQEAENVAGEVNVVNETEVEKLPQTSNEAATAVTGNVKVSRSTDPNYQSIAPTALQPIFAYASQLKNIDQKLLETVAYYESKFRTDAVSSAGAVGVMQLMPNTAKGLGVINSYDPMQNIMGGAQLLSDLYDRYNGDLDLMLAGYNAGNGAVKKYGGVPPYKETINYISKIKSKYTG